MNVVDWGRLADQLDTVIWTNGHSTKIACEALAAIIGDNELCAAVDFYLSHQPGFEVARSVLQLLSPPAAMERCRERFRQASNEGEAADTIELLRWVADKRVLGWMDEFQTSDSLLVRSWAIAIIDQLWMKGEVEPDEGRPYVEPALQDSDPIRSQAQQLLEMWGDAERLERESGVIEV